MMSSVYDEKGHFHALSRRCKYYSRSTSQRSALLTIGGSKEYGPTQRQYNLRENWYLACIYLLRLAISKPITPKELFKCTSVKKASLLSNFSSWSRLF